MKDSPIYADPGVCLAWASRKRHIALNGRVLCQAKSKNNGYSSNGQYNSIAAMGLPTYAHPGDTACTHEDGLIAFKPLAEQSASVVTDSICAKCLKKYAAALASPLFE